MTLRNEKLKTKMSRWRESAGGIFGFAGQNPLIFCFITYYV